MGSSFKVSTIFNGRDRMSPVFNKMGRSATGFGSVLKGVLGANIIQAGFRKLTMGAKSFITEAQKIEDATAGFTPLMGSMEKATELVNRLNKEAATTPFQFEGISSVAKQLLPVMNGSIEKTADTFRMLGDTAGGNINKLESITRGYTKALLKGKPDMEALNMIAEAGVPIFSEMAKEIGVTQTEFFQLSKQGKLTNDQLTATFKSMTKEGGIFYNGMKIASETLTGKLSTLKDNINLTKASIGKQLLPVIKPLIDRVIEAAAAMRVWVENNGARVFKETADKIKAVYEVVKKLWPILKTIAPLIIGIVAAFTTYSIIMKTVIAVQTIMNAVITANPLGVLLVTIGLLVGAIYMLIKNWKSVWEWMKKVFAFVAAKAMIAFAPFILAGQLIIKAWEPVKNFFMGLWNTLTGFIGFVNDKFFAVIDKISSGISKVKEFFGLGEKGENRDAPNRRETEARAKIEGNLNVNVKAEEGTSATIDSSSRVSPRINYKQLGYQP